MGENDIPLEDPPPKITEESDFELAGLDKISLQKDECSVDASLNSLHSNPKRRRIEQGQELTTDSISQFQSDMSDISPSVIKSRYGRTHKPKIPEDFLPTDKKVAAILGHSPHKSPGKGTGSPVSTTPVEVAKVCQKSQRLFDIFVKKDKCSKGNTEMENLNGNSNMEKLGVSSVKSETLDIKSDNVDSLAVRVEAASADNILIPENVKEEVESEVTDTICETSEMSLCDEKMSGCDWVIGDLAWARVSGYPFWPCMICLDPQQRIFTKTIVRGNFTLRTLHVQFFGDNGRRSWLYSNCVIQFEGLEALNKLAAKVQSKVKKRDRKLAAAFHVAPKAKAKWDIAVREAEAAMRRTRIERLQDFARCFPQDTSVKNAQTHSPSPRKRQQKSVNDDGISSSSKLESIEEGTRSPNSDVVTDTNGKDWTLSVTHDSKLKISSSQMKKKKQNKKQSFDDYDLNRGFKAFLYRHAHHVTFEHPELSAKAVEKYLANEWDGMGDVEKTKYCVRFSDAVAAMETTKMSISEEEEDDDGGDDERQSNESEKADSSGTRDSSPAPFVKLRKGCGLFRGTKQEKVCQICEKPGDTVKCRGPCCGTFHLKCVSKALAVEENMNDATPGSMRIAKSKIISTDHLNKADTGDSSFKVVDGGDNKEVRELTDISEAEDELPKPVNGMANLIENSDLLDENECRPVSRKRKRFSAEQECVANKKVDKEKTLCKNDRGGETRKDESEKISEEKGDGLAVERSEQEQGYKKNVKQETDELKMDTDKVNGTEDLESDNTESKVKGDESQIVVIGEKEIKEDVRESSVIKKENHTERSSEEVPEQVNQDVVGDRTVSDGRESEGRVEGYDGTGNKGGKKGAERDVVAKRENQNVYRRKDEKGGEKCNWDGSKGWVKDAIVSAEKGKYKRATRVVAKKRDNIEMRVDGKEIEKETKVTSEDKYRDERKERSVSKKKDKEERKGKDGVTEEKALIDSASEFRCKDCKEGRNPPCFACGRVQEEKTGREQRQRCAVGHCGKFYHTECLKLWPHAWSSGSLSSRRQSAAAARGEVVTGGQAAVTCPQHVCHTCASDDPRNATTRFAHERLVRCIRCPTAYHTGNYCLPAGSEVLTGTQIICPKHYQPPQKKTYHVNAAWCFICAMGGSLICCDLCPTSFHAECLRLSPPEGSFICEDCDTGRFPLYGEIVWVKLGAYRWWPAQILYPSQIPENIQNLPHVRGEFAVRFFGSHDHYWVNRGRVFLYQEGDTGHSTSRKSYMEDLFNRALREASEAHKILELEKATRDAEVRPVMKPPMYVKIKSNKPVGNVRVTEMDLSSMTPCECDPNSANPCGPDTDCLNRILLVECSPSVCMAGERCGNQCFEKRLYPPLIPYRTETRGWGLKTLANIRKGDFVIEYVGEMIDEAEYQRRMARKHEEKDENYYFLTIDKDRMLDAGPKGNVARFMNHSCQPNCETQKWTVNGDTRVGLFALVDIPAGAELTFNYNLESVGTDKKPCMCGAPNCSGFIGVKVNKVEEEKKPRAESQNLVKRRKKRRSSIRVNDDMCFICGEGGELLLCDNKTCPRGYHIHCLKLKRPPQGKWLCPWHRCNKCNKRTVRRCGSCPNSFCPQHADGNIRVHPAIGFVCQEHDKETPANVKEESFDSVAELDDKMEREEGGTSEESSGPTPEINYTDQEIKDKNGHGKNTGIEMIIEDEPHESCKETTVERCVREEPMAKESALPSSDKDKNDLSDELPKFEVKSSADINEEEYPKEDILIQNDTSSYDDMIPEVNSVCDDLMVEQNVTDGLVKSSDGNQKRKRGRPRKQTVQENLQENKQKNNDPCGMSEFSKIALDNELEGIAQSFSPNEVFNGKQHKLSRRHKKKLHSSMFEKDASVSDLEKGLVKNQGGQASKISSAVVSKLGFEVGEVHFEEQCGSSGDFGQETTEEEKESVDMIVEHIPVEVKAESSMEVQKTCNETKSNSPTVVTVNGTEATSVFLLPVES